LAAFIARQKEPTNNGTVRDIETSFSRSRRFSLSAKSLAARLGSSLGSASTKKAIGGSDLNGRIKVGAAVKYKRNKQGRKEGQGYSGTKL
jgi:hypothetical protein